MRRLLSTVAALALVQPALALTPGQRAILPAAAASKPVWSCDFRAGILCPGLTYTGAALGGLVTVPKLNTDGSLTGSTVMTTKRHQLLLNNATLSTQTVTPLATYLGYILSFYGTGSVQMSGGSTYNLVGTGANNQVYYRFAPTTNSVTFTVTGSVTNAALSAVTYETTPAQRPFDNPAPTTSVAYYGPAFEWDTSGNALGLRMWEVRANYAPMSGSLASATYWGEYHITAVTGVAAPDGSTNAVTITATGNIPNIYNMTIFGTTAASPVVGSVYLKGGTNTSPYVAITDVSNNKYVAVIDMSITPPVVSDSKKCNSVTGYSATVTQGLAGFWRVSVAGTVPGSSTYLLVGLAPAATGNTFDSSCNIVAAVSGYAYAWGAQLEQASTPGPYIPTGSSAPVSSAADSLPNAGTIASGPWAYRWGNSSGVSSCVTGAGGAWSAPVNGWMKGMWVYGTGKVAKCVF